jgi:hypothetical protein
MKFIYYFPHIQLLMYNLTTALSLLSVGLVSKVLGLKEENVFTSHKSHQNKLCRYLSSTSFYSILFEKTVIPQTILVLPVDLSMQPFYSNHFDMSI